MSLFQTFLVPMTILVRPHGTKRTPQNNISKENREQCDFQPIHSLQIPIKSILRRGKVPTHKIEGNQLLVWPDSISQIQVEPTRAAIVGNGYWKNHYHSWRRDDINKFMKPFDMNLLEKTEMCVWNLVVS